MNIKVPEYIADMGTLEELVTILQTIAPYVIVTGSYAYGTQTAKSDIDFYVKDMPEDEIDYEASYVEDTYCKPLIRFFEGLGFDWDSAFTGSFDVQDTYIPLEFSSYYSIEDDTFEIDVFGVKMTAAKSNYTSGRYLNGQKRR